MVMGAWVSGSSQRVCGELGWPETVKMVISCGLCQLGACVWPEVGLGWAVSIPPLPVVLSGEAKRVNFLWI